MVDGGYRVQSLLDSVDNNTPERGRPCDIQKLINFLNLNKVCGNDRISNNASGTFQENRWFISYIYLTTAFGCHIFYYL
jgi:hypothetical protein